MEGHIMVVGGKGLRNPMPIAVLIVFVIMFGFVTAWADGTETLGTPSVPIASGTNIIAAGTGMLDQPETININIPAGATIEQVLLYWEGQMSTNVPGDDTIEVEGIPITGTLIGGQTFFFSGAFSSSFRADITNLGLIAPGANNLTLDGLDFTNVANGAGVLVIIDEGTDFANLEIRDGLDLAFFNFPEPRRSTVPQTFNFAPEAVDREATLNLFFSSVAGTASTGGPLRPSVIEVSVDGATSQFVNVLNSVDGEEWDTFTTAVLIPAGASSLTVEAISTTSNSPLGASFAWIAAGLSVPIPPPLGDQGCTPGYWKNHEDAWSGFSPSETVVSVFSEAAAFPNQASATLLEALSFKGGPRAEGGAQILLRAAVASLLNAAHPDVSFTRTVSDVIDEVNAALASGNRAAMLSLATVLDDENNSGCPLD